MDKRTTDQTADAKITPQSPIPGTGADGKAVYDQAFFLALARCGKNVWNRWRDSHSDIPIIFSGVDFRESKNRSIDFSGLRFGNYAKFDRCKFGDGLSPLERSQRSKPFQPGMANFLSAEFGDGANFSYAEFGDWVEFSDAVFGKEANFFNARFKNNVSFTGALFGARANFYDARIVYGNFIGTIFGNHAQFAKAEIKFAMFTGSVFGEHAQFTDATLGDLDFGQVFFRAATFGRRAEFSAKFLSDADFGAETREWLATLIARGGRVVRDNDESRTLKEELKAAGAAPDRFVDVSFDDAIFNGEASFVGRQFLGPCRFRNVEFETAPDCAGCEGLEWIEFISVSLKHAGHRRLRILGWTTDDDVLLRIRRLRALAEITKNHDFERDLYIEERKAQLGVELSRRWAKSFDSKFYGNLIWAAAICVYWLLADCGRSFVRPLIVLLVGATVFWVAYTFVLIPPGRLDTTEGRLRARLFDDALQAFAISNAIPVVGPLTLERDVKLTLLCGDRPIDAQHAQASGQPVCVPIPGRRFQLLALAQSIFSALCLFFAGLALRNYFKLK